MIDLNLEMIDIYDIIDKVSLETVEKKKGNYNQSGKNNNNYKNGISMYGNDAKKPGAKCSKCGGTKNLMVHHKDGNRKNNSASNREVLCWSCHEKGTRRK